MRKFGFKRLNKEYSFDDELKYAKEEARKEGTKRAQKKVALNMLKDNFSLTEISEIIELPIEEIEKLIREKST